MLLEGTTIYFIVNGYIMSGKVFNVTGSMEHYTFNIEGFGGCSGYHTISNSQIHHTIFLSEEEANQYLNNPQMYMSATC